MTITEKEALKRLKLPENPERQEIEKAYEKMVMRYPPEFHPEKFRKIEEAYTFLTSLSYRLERACEETVEITHLIFPSPPGEEEKKAALKCIERERLLNSIFLT